MTTTFTGPLSVHLCTLFGCHNELREDWTKPKSGIQEAFRLWGSQGLCSSSERACVSASRRVKLQAACAKISSTVSVTPRSHSSDAIDMKRRANFSCIDVREIVSLQPQVWKSRLVPLGSRCRATPKSRNPRTRHSAAKDFSVWRQACFPRKQNPKN